MDDLSKQADEIEVLSSIYGSDWKAESDHTMRFSLQLSEGDKEITLFFTLPDNYPSESPPQCEVQAPYLNRDMKSKILDALNEVYMENLGESVLYQWIEKVREILQTLPSHNVTEKEIVQNVISIPRLIQKELRCPQIVHGQVIEDRRSHFQAHVAVITSIEDVEAVLWTLKSERKIAEATHNIVAWRCGRSHDCDDDGEKAAGPRLLRLLTLANLDNTIVVVSRWYGGIHLGPDRFRHINNAARQALVQAGFLSS